MNTRCSPMDLAIDLIDRSSCNVRVAAVITDRTGRIFSWGWNHAGVDGLGECAEALAIRRANRNRLKGSTIYVAGMRVRNGKFVPSKPCQKCQKLLEAAGIKRVFYLTSTRDWISIEYS